MVTEVEYELTVEDMLALRRHLTGQRTHGLRSWPDSYWLMVMVVGALFFVVAFSKFLAGEDYLLMVLIGLFFPVLAVGRFLYDRRANASYWRRYYELNPDLLGYRRFSISVEGINVSEKFISSTLRWDGIDDIISTLNHAFFFYGADEAVTLPRRAFSSHSEFEEFVQTARGYHAMAHGLE